MAFRRTTVDRGALEGELLGLVDAAVALQPSAEATLAECVDRSVAKDPGVARRVAVVLDGYAFVLARLNRLPRGCLVDEVTGLVRYHHLLVATTSRHFFNTTALTAGGVDGRFCPRLGAPAAKLRRIQARLAANRDHHRPAPTAWAADRSLRRPMSRLRLAESTLNQSDIEWDEPVWRRLVGMIDSESVRIGQILDNVLCMALLDAGDLEVSLAPVDVEAIVQAAMDHLSPALTAGRDVEITVDPDVTTAAGCFLWTDRRLAIQALRELLDNAARHGGPAAHLAVTARHTAGRIEIAVIDDGPGLPPLVRDHVSSRGGRGLPHGIGIATAVGLANALGGHLDFSTHGPGTRCLLRLPAA